MGLRTSFKLAPDDPRHGTTNGYTNYRCRCDRCKDANRLARAGYLKRLRAEGRVVGKHGSAFAYDAGCRCDACREAHNTKSREYKRRRRIQQRVDAD